MTMQRRLLYFFMLCPLLILGSQILLVAVVRYQWSTIDASGPLVEPATWPAPIQDLQAAMEREGLATDRFEVYRLDVGVDDSAIVRTANSPGAFDFLKRYLELSAVDNLPANRLDVDRLPADWWVSGDRDAELYASVRFLSGEEGFLYVVTRSVDGELLYICYMVNL